MRLRGRRAQTTIGTTRATPKVSWEGSTIATTRSFAELFDDPRLKENVSRLPTATKLKPGQRTPKKLNVPVKSLRKVLPEVTRLVADLPKDSLPRVVWTDGFSELLVHTDFLRLTVTTGLIRVSLRVRCDQIQSPVVITVPFAVGTKDRVTGLAMSTFDVVEGPPVVVDPWADAIIAFCWECILELVRRLSAEVGNDGAGRALIPGSIAAAPNTIIIQPMARHKLSIPTRR